MSSGNGCKGQMAHFTSCRRLFPALLLGCSRENVDGLGQVHIVLSMWGWSTVSDQVCQEIEVSVSVFRGELWMGECTCYCTQEPRSSHTFCSVICEYQMVLALCFSRKFFYRSLLATWGLLYSKLCYLPRIRALSR